MRCKQMLTHNQLMEAKEMEIALLWAQLATVGTQGEMSGSTIAPAETRVVAESTIPIPRNTSNVDNYITLS